MIARLAFDNEADAGRTIDYAALRPNINDVMTTDHFIPIVVNYLDPLPTQQSRAFGQALVGTNNTGYAVNNVEANTNPAGGSGGLPNTGNVNAPVGTFSMFGVSVTPWLLYLFLAAFAMLIYHATEGKK